MHNIKINILHRNIINKFKKIKNNIKLNKGLITKSNNNNNNFNNNLNIYNSYKNKMLVYCIMKKGQIK